MCEYGFNENDDFRLVGQKRATNNPKSYRPKKTDSSKKYYNLYRLRNNFRYGKRKRVAQKRPTNNPKNPITTYIDYEITIDMAKEISMIQRSEKGKQARQYFIQCEKFIQDSKLTEEFKYYRKTGKIARKDLTDTIKEKLQPSNQFVYGNYTELGYLKVFGKKTKELKQERNLKPKDNLRNHFTPEELKEVLKVEEEIKSLIIAFNLMNIDKKEVYKKIKEIMLKNQ